MTKIVFPTIDQNGLDGVLADHFGRAPYFTVVDFDLTTRTSSVHTVPNRGEHFGGTGHAHDFLLELKPNVIVVYGMGPRGIMGFQSAGIEVLKAKASTVKENLDAFLSNNLSVLSEGCQDAQHR